MSFGVSARVENWYDNSVSINSIFIDKIDNPNSTYR